MAGRLRLKGWQRILVWIAEITVVVWIEASVYKPATAATRVADVKLLDPRSQSLSGVECGWIYRAYVVEDLKLGNSKFELVMTNDGDTHGFDRSFLVFVFSRESINPAVRAFLDATLEERERHRISCRLTQELYAPGGFETMWSTDPTFSQ